MLPLTTLLFTCDALLAAGLSVLLLRSGAHFVLAFLPVAAVYFLEAPRNGGRRSSPYAGFCTRVLIRLALLAVARVIGKRNIARLR